MIPPPYAAPSVVPGDPYDPGAQPVIGSLASTGVSSLSILIITAVLLIAAGVALYVTTRETRRIG